jgi:hypothetical protein
VVFTDVGTKDTHTAAWSWDDNPTDAGALVESGGSGTVDGSHAYAKPGSYTVTLKVSDDDGGMATSSWQVTVVDAHGARIIMNNNIQSLPSSAFIKLPNSVTVGKAALNTLINYDISMVDRHDYAGAGSFLLGNVRTMMDGLPNTMNKMNIDWIADPIQQHKLCLMVDDIAAYLSLMK